MFNFTCRCDSEATVVTWHLKVGSSVRQTSVFHRYRLSVLVSCFGIYPRAVWALCDQHVLWYEGRYTCRCTCLSGLWNWGFERHLSSAELSLSVPSVWHSIVYQLFTSLPSPFSLTLLVNMRPETSRNLWNSRTSLRTANVSTKATIPVTILARKWVNAPWKSKPSIMKH